MNQLPTSDENRPAVGVVFSRDRALQLDALLGSLLLQCQDVSSLQLNVLYTGSSDRFRKQYSVVEREWRVALPITFHPEVDFRRDLLRILGLPDKSALVRSGLYSRIRRYWHRVPRVHTLWEHLVFLVDDNLFVSPFSLGAPIAALRTQSHAIGFSLRLGSNVTNCYMLGRSQRSPEFFPTASTGVVRYNWADADGSFAYPLEVSSSIYSSRVIAGLLAALDYSNPNTLEAALARAITRFRLQSRRPSLLCFEYSVAFCDALNKVQTVYPDNRAGEEALGFSVNALADAFDAGLRVDPEALSGYVPDDTHGEVALRLIPRIARQ
jgi:hypothetical protein